MKDKEQRVIKAIASKIYRQLSFTNGWASPMIDTMNTVRRQQRKYYDTSNELTNVNSPPSMEETKEKTAKKKRFGGVAFSLFELRANSFDGFGFTLFQVRWDWLKVVCVSNTYNLLFVNLVKAYEYGGEEWKLRAGILFAFHGTIYTRVVKPRKSVCYNCGDLCNDTKFFVGNRPYCSSLCKSDGEY